MSLPSGISRRVQQCVERLNVNDYEGALVNLFPAIDKTAKKRRPRKNVGQRIRSFLKDEEVLITAVGIGSVFKDCKFGNYTLEEILYKFGRTSISHEGELDHRLTFNNSGKLEIGNDKWNLPIGYVAAMALAVIVAPENIREKTSEGLQITIFDINFKINEIWGKPDSVQSHICNRFNNADLFN